MPGRRIHLSAAVRGILVVVLTLIFGALLNAQGLRKTAQIQSPGLSREIALALTKPLAGVSHALYLDRPRQELKAALGRGNDDRIDTTIALPVAPRRPRKPIALPVAPRPRRPIARSHGKQSPPARRRVATRPAFSPGHPLRVWVAGDSLVAVPGAAIERAVGADGAVDVVAVESRLATGLGRPDIYNWYTRFPDAIREFRPRVAVLSFGADDGHNYMTGLPSGTTIGPLGSPSWNAEYRRRVEGVMGEMQDAGIYVVWLGLPIIRGPTQNHSFQTVNKVLRSVVAKFPRGATYIDDYRMFENGHGRYTDYLRDVHGRHVLMRAADGVHYQPAAGDLIARTVMGRLSEVFDLTSWKRGRGSKSR